MKKIVLAIAALFVAFGIISCSNPSNVEDEKKSNKAEIKIYVPDDGVDISEPYEYIFYIYENGVRRVDDEGNFIEYYVKPGSMLHLKVSNNTIFSIIGGIVSESGTNYGSGLGTCYVKKGELIKAEIILNDYSTPSEKYYGLSYFPYEDSILSFYPYMPDSPIGYNGTADRNYPYVEFGEWPQTIKDASVFVDESITEIHGVFTYCKGSDGAWYVFERENAWGGDYLYSDGSTAEQYKTVGKWFKVEPIKWRILNKDEYTKTGKALLLAEDILTAREYSSFLNNYQDSSIRIYLNNDFLETAFTKEQQKIIIEKTIDNSVASTVDNAGVLTPATDWVCEDTTDKIFLLSEYEVTFPGFGFDELPNGYPGDDARVRVPTDFAIAAGIYLETLAHGYNACWWLRSPNYGGPDLVSSVEFMGGSIYKAIAWESSMGVVPALWVDMQ